jgi:hypothetical protein
MPPIRPIDMTTLNQIFDMEGGYVLDFSDRTMGEFFAQEVNIDIDDQRYRLEGTSKAKRFRSFLKQSETEVAINALQRLWEHRQASLQIRNAADEVQNAQGRLLDIIDRLRSNKPTVEAAFSRPAFNWQVLDGLQNDLRALHTVAPQERGYRFEVFLKETFDLFGMKARDPFRNVGEQIDGSFELGNETYLLEAKWLNAKVGVGDLHAFHGKVDQKAAWARGVFVSYNGFSDEGLVGFGRGKRIVCVEGLDIDDAFTRRIPMNHVIEQKVRRAAETGNCFVRVRDLFP